MAKHIFRCSSCGQYTMKEKCPKCQKDTFSPKPPKYSPDDQYGGYRRKAKRQEYEEKGLI